MTIGGETTFLTALNKLFYAREGREALRSESRQGRSSVHLLKRHDVLIIWINDLKAHPNGIAGLGAILCLQVYFWYNPANNFQGETYGRYGNVDQSVERMRTEARF